MNPAAIPKSRLVFAIPALALGVCLIDHRFNLDIVCFKWINAGCAQLPDALWANLTLLGNGWICFALAFPLIVFAPRLLISGLITGVFTAILSNLLKKIAHTPRPAGVLELHSFHVIGHPLFQGSMPSGHTMTAFGCVSAVYFALTPRQRRPLWLLFLLAAAVGLSRIAMGAHWPQDVAVGTVLGLFAGLLASRIARAVPERYLAPSAWPAFVSYVGSVVCFYMLLASNTVDPTDQLLTPKLGATVIAMTWLAIAQRSMRLQLL
jgi:membrane-associated phospholipid phosphatase